MSTNKDNAADGRKWLILTVVVLKVMMDGLDASMLNIALPSISLSLGVTSGAVIWVVSVYSIITATTVLFFGRLGDMIGKTRFYLIGIAVYVISTLFSGTANSLPMLIVSRVIQAVGAGCTMANSQGIIAMAFPQRQRGTALGIYGGAISVGTLAGPALGGLVVAYMGWRYIFLLKIPIAVIAIILGLIYFPRDVPAQKEKMDYPGMLLFIVAVIPLLYSLQEGYSKGYTHVFILAGLTLSIAAFIAFFTMQRKKTMPLLDLGLFKNSLFSVGVFTSFIQAFTTMLRIIILPFYLQGVLNTPVEIAGLYMSAAPVITLFVTPVSGYLSDKVGSEKLSIVGQVLNCAGLLLMATLTKESPALTMIVYLSIVSLGTALFLAPNNALIMANVPPDKLGIGGSVNMSIRNIGMSVGVAFATAALYGGMSGYLGHRVTDYVQGTGMDDAFMYGMRSAHLLASLLCVMGITASVLRIIAAGKKKRNSCNAP